MELARAVVGEPPDGCAIYFLLNGDDREVVYVGASTNPGFRYTNHTDKEFTHVCFLPVPEGQMLEVEDHWIKTLRPKYNKRGNPDHKHPRLGKGVMVKKVMVQLPQDLVDGLRELRKTLQYPVRTSELIRGCIRMHLESRGFWPPKS